MKTIFKGKYLNVITKPHEGVNYEMVEAPDAAAILLHTKTHVILVEQYRPAVGAMLKEIPAGLINKGEEPMEAAIREAAEETGYRPTTTIKLLDYYHIEGYSTGKMYLYIGTDLEEVGQNLDANEKIKVLKLPITDFLYMINCLEVKDTKTLIAGMLFSKYIQRFLTGCYGDLQ